MNELQFRQALLAALGATGSTANEAVFRQAFVDALRNMEGTPGPAGPEGPEGPQGPAGSNATVTYANVSALSGDWKGTGAATLSVSLVDLETRLAALEA